MSYFKQLFRSCQTVMRESDERERVMLIVDRERATFLLVSADKRPQLYSLNKIINNCHTDNFIVHTILNLICRNPKWAQRSLLLR